MALIQIVAGRYACTYQPSAGFGASGFGGPAVDVGITSGDGYELSWTTHQQVVNDTDAYGQMILEGVYRGADWKIRTRFIEFKQSNMNSAFPWGNTGAPLSPVVGVIARRASDVAGAVVLTSTAGTPAENNPATITASSAIISPNINLTMNFTSKVRELPMEWTLLPYLIAPGVPGWFLTT